MVAPRDGTNFDLIQMLRSWFFALDRDIRLQTGKQLVTQDGTNVEDALEAQFVILATDGDLDNERVLTAGTGITLVDGGAGSTVTISVNASSIDGVVPSGGVIFWPSTAGAIPTGWSTFSAASGKFLVGTDLGTFTNGSTGGAETVNIQHSHTSGTLATDTDQHSHTSGTLATAADGHTHNVTSGTSDTPTGATFQTDNTGGSTVWGSHTHGPGSFLTDNDSHSHSVNSGSTANDTHGHNVDSGSTANALSTAQSILPPFLVGTWVQRD